MSELYTIRLEDQVTGNAYRIASAYADVSVAAQYMARSVKQGDKAMIELDRHQLRMARTSLMAAKAAESAGRAAAKIGPRLPTGAIKSNTAAMSAGTTQGFKFSYMMNALANQAVNLAFALARNLVGGLISVGTQLYEVADLATRAHMSFANFWGGTASGDKLLNESIDIAKRYGFTIEDTVAQMQRFGAAGFNQEQSKGLLRFGADMLAAGRSVQDVKGIFLAMTQIQGKGKLQAEELTQQLAERGINAGKVWQILGGILHKTVPEVMKLQKAGKIGSGVALNAIVQAGVEGVHGSAIGKAGEKVADATIGGLGRRMSTLIESEVFGAVDKSTPALVKGMQALFGGMGASDVSGLQDNLTKALEVVGSIMEKIGPKIPAMVAGFEKAFGAASGFNATGWQAFADSLPGIATNLGTIAGLLAKIAGLSVSLLHPLDTFGNNFKRFGNYITGQGYKTGAESGLISEQSQMNLVADTNSRKSGDDLIAEQTGKNIADGLASGVLSGAPSVGKAGESLAGSVVDAFSGPKGIDAHSPSKVFIGQGANVAKGLAIGMDQNADIPSHAASMMAGGSISGAAGALGDGGRKAISAGSAAGAAVSRSNALSVRVGDLYFGGGAGGVGGGGDAMSEARAYFETEFVSMLERHLEGVGA